MSLEEFLKNYKDPDIIELPREVQLQMYNDLKPSLNKNIKAKIFVFGTAGEIDNTDFNWSLDETIK